MVVAVEQPEDDENDAVSFVVEAMLCGNEPDASYSAVSSDRPAKKRKSWAFPRFGSGRQQAPESDDENEEKKTDFDDAIAPVKTTPSKRYSHEEDVPGDGGGMIGTLHSTWNKVSSRFRSESPQQGENETPAAAPTFDDHALTNTHILSRFRDAQRRYLAEDNVLSSFMTTVGAQVASAGESNNERSPKKKAPRRRRHR